MVNLPKFLSSNIYVLPRLISSIQTIFTKLSLGINLPKLYTTNIQLQ